MSKIEITAEQARQNMQKAQGLDYARRILNAGIALASGAGEHSKSSTFSIGPNEAKQIQDELTNLGFQTRLIAESGTKTTFIVIWENPATVAKLST